LAQFSESYHSETFALVEDKFLAFSNIFLADLSGQGSFKNVSPIYTCETNFSHTTPA
jgi:hypothetical protein